MMANFRRARIRRSLLAGLAVALGLTIAPAVAAAERLQALATGAMANFTLSDPPKPALDIQFVDGEGGRVTLADFRGKVVLLNFWATWCAPCRREMPDLAELKREFGPDGFDVAAVSGDRQGPAVIAPFYAQIGVTGLAVYNDRSMKSQRAFRVYGLPTTLLLDREGRELGRLLGPAEWASPEAKALIAHFVDAKPEMVKKAAVAGK